MPDWDIYLILNQQTCSSAPRYPTYSQLFEGHPYPKILDNSYFNRDNGSEGKEIQ